MTERNIAAARRSVLIIFFLHGAVFATWVARIPAVKSQLGLSAAQLGLALLGIAAGCLISMPVSGYLIGRFGSRPVTAVSSLVFTAALALPGLAFSQSTLAITLGVLGLAAGAMDVSMNAHAVAVERMSGRHFMSGFHALFSIGGMAGAALGGLVAAAGIAPRAHFAGAAVIAAAITLAAIPGLLPGHVDAISHEGSRLRITSALVKLSTLAFCFYLAEGAVADWSALYLRDTTGLPAGRSALGYAFFSAAMALGRLSGDSLRHRFTSRVLVKTGSVVAVAGLALIVGIPAAALLGFAIVGAGCSIVVPIVFAAAGSIEGTSVGAALAVMTTCGYMGLFAGPPMIGFVAEASSLRIALALVIFLLAAGIVTAPKGASQSV